MFFLFFGKQCNALASTQNPRKSARFLPPINKYSIIFARLRKGGTLKSSPRLGNLYCLDQRRSFARIFRPRNSKRTAIFLTRRFAGGSRLFLRKNSEKVRKITKRRFGRFRLQKRGKPRKNRDKKSLERLRSRLGK